MENQNNKWKEFRLTGLIVFVNYFLHIFGWAIIFETDEKTDDILDVYPARVPWRGFSRHTTEQAYERVSKYMKENADDLIKEVWSSRITVDKKP